ncbi:transmembrane protein, putative (macronuclear) [Tetrahymena thermophila SB210]|uniref:Transmembrane protein, putative n=1 Tax=Tetrahymena thermophila (strain SB210) TaxID=312017 RepID=Q22U71_TETTS|nr:transmembrane protein, putative [Tetrahymena thermophila SB210]EAR88816.2 transmembrane protein, putative [Tetrahymena thermophila SB210]|eukprot:XP_001009061.2 transmembrane protein, putative [Tetrahymena thermophila SB210]
MNRIRQLFQNPKYVYNIAIGSGVGICLLAIKQAAFFFNKVQDDEMNPYLEKGDIVISFKGIDHGAIKNKIALIYEPIKKSYIFRRVKGIPNDFVQDYGSRINIFIPQGTMYVESEQQTKLKDNANLSEIIGSETLQDKIKQNEKNQNSNPYENVFYMSLLVGVPLFRIYPLNKIGMIQIEQNNKKY